MVTDIRESIEKVFFIEGSEVVNHGLIIDRRAFVSRSLSRADVGFHKPLVDMMTESCESS